MIKRTFEDLKWKCATCGTVSNSPYTQCCNGSKPVKIINKLDDLSPMPFGMYKGKSMQDVPVAYLHYLYTKPPDSISGDMLAVRDYIERSLDALKMENPDLIWK